MYIKRVKRKCSVRGCKNTDCFAISRTREVGNTVIVCRSCLENALAAIDELPPNAKSNVKNKGISYPEALFFLGGALGLTEEETRAQIKRADEEAEEEIKAIKRAIAKRGKRQEKEDKQ